MRGRKAAEQQLVIKLVKGIIVGLDRWIIYVILDTQQFYGVKMCKLVVEENDTDPAKCTRRQAWESLSVSG
jgi:hypothetical protein